MRKFLGKSSGAWLGVAQLPDGSKGEHKVSLGPNDKGEKEREEEQLCQRTWSGSASRVSCEQG